MRACKRGSRNVKISLKGVALDPGDDAEEEFKEDFSGCEGDAHEEDPNGYVPSRDDWPSAATVDEIEERQSATPQQEQGGDQDNIADRVMHWGDYDTVEPASTTPRYDAEVRSRASSRKVPPANGNLTARLDTIRNQVHHQHSEQRRTMTDMREGMALLHRKVDQLFEGIGFISDALAPRLRRVDESDIAPPPMPDGYRHPMMPTNSMGPQHQSRHSYAASTPNTYGPASAVMHACMHPGQTDATFYNQSRPLFPMSNQGSPFSSRLTDERVAGHADTPLSSSIVGGRSSNKKALPQRFPEPNTAQPFPVRTEEQQRHEGLGSLQQGPAAGDIASQQRRPLAHCDNRSALFDYHSTPRMDREQQQPHLPHMDPSLNTLWEGDQKPLHQ